ncbi:MAG TPA: plastocyanin/azurin family copper-binding protein [Gemmatimonadaceae bacterium]|nr:plastocyanin/azurin family copper-binding protein [Gemmatimonadaceae bacterium]
MSTRVPVWIPALLCLAACGGGEKTPAAGASTSTATPAPAASVAAMPATGVTHAVQMVQDASGYHYSPAAVTVKEGDAIAFTVASGIPHNVTFWPDSIPAAGQAQLNANMPNTTTLLTGPLLTAVGQSYTISFAGVTPGVYKMYCTPHLQYGMKGTITVQ